jgi:hypothetical protein
MAHMMFLFMPLILFKNKIGPFLRPSMFFLTCFSIILWFDKI